MKVAWQAWKVTDDNFLRQKLFKFIEVGASKLPITLKNELGIGNWSCQCHFLQHPSFPSKSGQRVRASWIAAPAGSAGDRRTAWSVSDSSWVQIQHGGYPDLSFWFSGIKCAIHWYTAGRHVIRNLLFDPTFMSSSPDAHVNKELRLICSIR